MTELGTLQVAYDALLKDRDYLVGAFRKAQKELREAGLIVVNAEAERNRLRSALEDIRRFATDCRAASCHSDMHLFREIIRKAAEALAAQPASCGLFRPIIRAGGEPSKRCQDCSRLESEHEEAAQPAEQTTL